MTNENEEFEFRLRAEREAGQRQLAPQLAAPAAPQSDPLKEAAPYYMGPAGTPRAVRDILHGIDTATNYLSNRAGEGATDIATGMGASPETAAKFGMAANVGVQAVPALVTGFGSAAAAAPKMESMAQGLMRRTIKPNAEMLKSGEYGRAVQTMFEKGINATEGAMSEAKATVGSLETKLQDILDKSPAVIDPYKAADNITKAIKDVGLNIDQAKNISDIEKVYTKFINHPAIKDLGAMPVALANKMKQAFYAELKDKAFVPGADLTASAKGQKAIASGLRQEIAAAEPAVAPTLAEQSELLNVLKVAGPQAAREGNKNVVGFGALSPRLENVLVWMVDRYPWFKSYLARTLHSGSERIPAYLGGGATIAEQQMTKEELPTVAEQNKKRQDDLRKQRQESSQRQTALYGVRG